MDLHQAFRILRLPDDGELRFLEPAIARETAPLRGLTVGAKSVTCEIDAPCQKLLSIRLDGGRHLEMDVPAWSACALVVHDGFCLTGTDGESPDAHPGQVAVYRRRNKDSSLILVAGPQGCHATLVMAAGSAPATP